MLTKEDFRHKVLLVPVNKCFDKPGVSRYDAIRYSWIVSKPKVDQVEYVLGVKQGEIVGVLEPNEWQEAKKKNFPTFQMIMGIGTTRSGKLAVGDSDFMAGTPHPRLKSYTWENEFRKN